MRRAALLYLLFGQAHPCHGALQQFLMEIWIARALSNPQTHFSLQPVFLGLLQRRAIAVDRMRKS